MSTATAIASGGWSGGLPVGPITAPPIGVSIVTWALQYIEPLAQWRDELLGDPGQAMQAAQSWREVEATLSGVATELRSAERQLGELQGRTIRVLSLRYEDLRPAVEDASGWAGAVAAAAELTVSIVAGVRSFIEDFLVRLERLIGALFGFSLNPFEKIEELKQLIDAAWEFIQAGHRLIQRMFDAFANLVDLIASLGPVIDHLLVELRETIARMMPAIGTYAAGVFGLVGGGVIRDAMMDIGEVRRYPTKEELEAQLAATDDPEEQERLREKIRALEAAQTKKSLDLLSDLVDVNGTTDALGGAESTAIDIKLVRAADGSEHWVVSCPSTQEWFDMFGNGAMNDGKNNLALMAGFESQYERAVLKAMREAGMQPGDPVVYTGFSQGGILAARLASNSDYQAIGVVTNGSPIDTMNVPRNVPVVALQHANDLVPKTDLGGMPGTPPNVRHVNLPSKGDVFNMFSDEGAHNNNNYVDSLKNVRPDIDQMYSWMGGEVIDHQIFESVQR